MQGELEAMDVVLEEAFFLLQLPHIHQSIHIQHRTRHNKCTRLELMETIIHHATHLMNQIHHIIATTHAAALHTENEMGKNSTLKTMQSRERDNATCEGVQGGIQLIE